MPVFANGNIQSLEDIERCFKETGVDGVMSAEGNLHNPAIFTGKRVPVWTIAEEYLNLVKQYPCPLSYARGHIFKIFHHCFALSSNQDLREEVAKGQSIKTFEEVTSKIKSKYQSLYEREIVERENKHENNEHENNERENNERENNEHANDQRSNDENYNNDIPVYFCQPYFRPKPKCSLTQLNGKRPSCEEQNNADGEIKISKKKLKRLTRRALIKEKEPRRGSICILCALCPNPKGQKCDYDLCKACCRNKTYLEILNCTGSYNFLNL